MTERFDRQLSCDRCCKVVEVINVLSSEVPERWLCENCMTRRDQLHVLFSMTTYQYNCMENDRELDEAQGIVPVEIPS